MPKTQGTLKVSGDSYEVEWTSNKGNPITREVPVHAQCFRDEDAEDGCDVKIKFASGKIRKVTIRDCEVVAPQKKKRTRPPKPKTGPKGRGKRRSGTPARRDARAPFNFVPYDPERVALWEEDDRPDPAEALSGRITCTLDALTPLLVAGQKGQMQDNDVPRTFYEVDGTPVVPASSLKGMVRQVLEVMSFGKLAPVSPGQIYRRNVSDDSYKCEMEDVRAGFLERHGAEARIYPARFARVHYNTLSRALNGRSKLFGALGSSSGRKRARSRLQNYFAGPKTDEWMKVAGSHRVSFAAGRGGLCEDDPYVERLSPDPQKEQHQGVVVFTGHFPTKKKDYVFFDPDADPMRVPDEVYDRFREQMTEPQEDLRKVYEKTKRNRIPVFWLPDGEGGVAEIGLARMFRLHCRHCPRELAEAGEGGRDFCERLFGYADSDGSLRGRIRFSPARPEPGTIHERQAPFRAITAGPSASCVSLYLKQDGARARRSGRGRNMNLITYDFHHPELRGRKFYWHKVAEEPDLNNVSEEMQCDYFPLQEDARFHFSIDFEDLSRPELGGLLQALTLAGDKAHKLGLGKPFGLGSVTVEIERSEFWMGGQMYADLAERITGGRSLRVLDASIRRDLRSAFQEEIAGRVGFDPASYNSQPEIRALGTMLRCKQDIPATQLTYMPLQGKPGYGDRPILRPPHEVART